MIGVDVARLDVTAFLAAARVLYPMLGLAWLALLLKIKKPWWLLLGALLANGYAWGVTNYPLQRLYALGPSRDRVSNVALCQVVAAGNSPLQTWQVGQLHFEPFWGLLVAAVSAWSPERVLALYPFFPLVMAVGFALSLYYGLRPPPGAAPPGEAAAWSPWERALVAGFATLLSSSPLDFAGVYRVPWALTFLLKPNHALGLVLLPVVLRAVASIKGWAGRIGAGLLLHLLGWVFVIHMMCVAVGLVVFAAVSSWSRREEARRDVLDVAVVLGVNLLAVSPYLLMLAIGYPAFRPAPHMVIAASSAHLLEITARVGWIFWLGAWGAAVAYRRGDRLGRLWATQVLGAALVWVGYLLLSALQMARERDDVLYWTRFLLAASAGIGAWDLAGRAAGWLGRPSLPPAYRAAAVALLAVPWSLPYWWDPARMDSYFTQSTPPIPEHLRRATDFLRRETDPRDVIAGDPDFARYAAALGARRALLGVSLHAPKDDIERWRVHELLLSGSDSQAALAAAQQYGVRYLVVTPTFLASQDPPVDLESLRRLAHLRLALLTTDPAGNFIAIFRLVRPDR